jgi:hypothetical protein
MVSDNEEKKDDGEVRNVLSSIFNSGSNNYHAHKLGELQWEYCNSLINQIEQDEQGIVDTTSAMDTAADTTTAIDSTDDDPEEIGRFVVLLFTPEDATEISFSGHFNSTHFSSSATKTTKKRKQKKNFMGTASYSKKVEKNQAIPPRLARIVGGITDPGHINVEIYVPLPLEDDETNELDYDNILQTCPEQNLKLTKYVREVLCFHFFSSSLLTIHTYIFAFHLLHLEGAIISASFTTSINPLKTNEYY